MSSEATPDKKQQPPKAKKKEIGSRSAKKRIRQSKKRRVINRSLEATMKTTLRSLKEAPIDSRSAILKTICSLADKGAKKGIFKKNRAARIKSRASAFLKK